VNFFLIILFSFIKELIIRLLSIIVMTIQKVTIFTEKVYSYAKILPAGDMKSG